MTMQREHLEKLTKAQLVDELDRANTILDDRLAGLDDEARAFHFCVTALDKLKPKKRDTYGYLTSSSGWDERVALVIGYLKARYGIRDDAAAIKAELDKVRRERDEAVAQLENVRAAAAGGHMPMGFPS